MNLTFLAYAEHQQDLEDAVSALVEATRKGQSGTLEFKTAVSNEDIAWVVKEAERRIRANGCY